MLGDKSMPPDPFDSDHEVPDLSGFGMNCRVMFNSLVNAGFSEEQALEFTIRVMTALFMKAAK